MRAYAAALTLGVVLDIETMEPELKLDIDIDPSFSFLAGNRELLAGWLRAAANSLEAADPDGVDPA